MLDDVREFFQIKIFYITAVIVVVHAILNSLACFIVIFYAYIRRSIFPMQCFNDEILVY